MPNSAIWCAQAHQVFYDLQAALRWCTPLRWIAFRPQVAAAEADGHEGDEDSADMSVEITWPNGGVTRMQVHVGTALDQPALLRSLAVGLRTTVANLDVTCQNPSGRWGRMRPGYRVGRLLGPRRHNLPVRVQVLELALVEDD